MNKKLSNYLFVSTAIFVVFSSFPLISVAASELQERDKIIEKKLNCLAYNLTDDKNAGWADVCSTDVPTPQADGRAELIDRELTATANRLHFQDQEPIREDLPVAEESASQDIEPAGDDSSPQDDIAADDGSEQKSSQEFERHLKDEGSSQYRDYEIKSGIYEAKDQREHLKKTEIALQMSSYRYTADPYSLSYYAAYYDVPNEVEKNGNFFGASLSYTYRRPYQVPVHSFSDLKEANGGPGYPFTFYRVEADASWGEVSYKAYIPGKRDGFAAWRGNFRLLGGYDLQSQDLSFMATPYVGIGYKRFSDDAGAWVDSWAIDYEPFEKTYQYFYLPVGVETLKHMNPRWDIGFRAEASFLLVGSVAFGQSDIQGSFNGTDYATGDPIVVSLRDTDSDLRNGFGLKTSFKVVRKYESFNLFVEPFVEFWYLGKSKAVEIWAVDADGKRWHTVNLSDGSRKKDTFEPANYTVESGLRAGVQF